MAMNYYDKYDYGLQCDYNVDYSPSQPAGTVTMTMTMQQFEEFQRGFEERVEAIFDRKLKEVFGDD
jgi:hypothetical protein